MEIAARRGLRIRNPRKSAQNLRVQNPLSAARGYGFADRGLNPLSANYFQRGLLVRGHCPRKLGDSGFYPPLDADTRILSAHHYPRPRKKQEIRGADYPLSPAWIADARRSTRIVSADSCVRSPAHSVSRYGGTISVFSIDMILHMHICTWKILQTIVGFCIFFAYLIFFLKRFKNPKIR